MFLSCLIVILSVYFISLGKKGLVALLYLPFDVIPLKRKFVCLTHDAMDWSAVYDGGITWSCSPL